MKELKLKLDNVDALEAELAAVGARARRPHWIGNWYLETTPVLVRKIMLLDRQYTYLELQQTGAGFVFNRQELLGASKPIALDSVPEHDILHKTVKPWVINNLRIDILLFEDIEPHLCITFEEPHQSEAIRLVTDTLAISDPSFIRIPFNILKRRLLGISDFD